MPTVSNKTRGAHIPLVGCPKKGTSLPLLFFLQIHKLSGVVRKPETNPSRGILQNTWPALFSSVRHKRELKTEELPQVWRRMTGTTANGRVASGSGPGTGKGHEWESWWSPNKVSDSFVPLSVSVLLIVLWLSHVTRGGSRRKGPWGLSTVLVTSGSLKSFQSNKFIHYITLCAVLGMYTLGRLFVPDPQIMFFKSHIGVSEESFLLRFHWCMEWSCCVFGVWELSRCIHYIRAVSWAVFSNSLRFLLFVHLLLVFVFVWCWGFNPVPPMC